ncbi:MAG: TlpA family protein disulfide reductase [Phaeodactylibacter sp.]|nr:TlpA family protein disulfide reductase [Phaeodactylibacter sp.]MCB9303136.1 TlpA family protein disulfide reductase [Lewinellaceae bacterium]HQU59190.1 TlpA disulfide reductase family protein [Saprospiraceae bacterium]
MNRAKRFSMIFGLCLLFGGCSAGQQLVSNPGPPSGYQLDERLEQLQFTGLDGQPFNLKAYAGRPVFLNFWASWCAPCISEMGSIAEVFQQFGGEVAFLAVSTDDLSTIQQFQEKHSFLFPFAHLEGDYIDAFVIKLPTTLLISREGKLLFEEEGMRIWTTEALRQKVEAIAK